MELLFLRLDISGWLTGAGAILLSGIVVTVLRKKGIVMKAKKFFNVMGKVTEEIGEAFIKTSDVFQAADQAIDKDGRLKEKSVKDVIREGKEAIIEWNDVIMVVKPRKRK
jgi:ABC-type transport system involved in Fe-S cluster assembly fused permease/ATPase subunit